MIYLVDMTLRIYVIYSIISDNIKSCEIGFHYKFLVQIMLMPRRWIFSISRAGYEQLLFVGCKLIINDQIVRSLFEIKDHLYFNSLTQSIFQYLLSMEEAIIP